MIEKNKIEDYRQQFPGLANKFYFNFGGQGTMSSPALDAILNSYKELENIGPFSLQSSVYIDNISKATKKAIARELNTTPDTITLTENVTSGCNIAIWGINWQQGDRILITDCEHPGVVAIVREIARRFALQIDLCPLLSNLDRGDYLNVINQYLHPRTRLVILSHIFWNTGELLPLKQIVDLCHNFPSLRPILVLVDGAQSVGSLALNLTELAVDFYAFTGHKWLCGPAGVGGLYINRQIQSQLLPTFVGWRGIITNNKGEIIEQKQDGQKFEIATSAYAQYQGLKEAILLHQQWGNAQQRYEKICQLSVYLWQKLPEIEGIICLKNKPPETGLISFQLPNNFSGEQVVQLLEKQGFYLRTIASPNCIRACIHYFSLPEEIDALITAIEEIINFLAK